MSDGSQMDDMAKLEHLLSHWQGHNDDHEANYRSWADKADSAGKKEAAGILRKAADATAEVTALFGQALKAIQSGE